MSYRTDSAEQATVAEEDNEHWDGEVQDEHVDDKRGVVDLRFGSVVIYSTGALHSFWNISAHSHMTNKPLVRTSASDEWIKLCVMLKTVMEYLDQPSRGGMQQVRAMTQVKPTPTMACFSPKRNVVIGLHTTI